MGRAPLYGTPLRGHPCCPMGRAATLTLPACRRHPSAPCAQLQFTGGPVSTKDLTRSFGWDSADAFQQHDVQELNRILCDRLEEKMKVGAWNGMGGWPKQERQSGDQSAQRSVAP